MKGFYLGSSGHAVDVAEQQFNATAAKMGQDAEAKRKADARLLAARADIHDALYEAHRYFAANMDVVDGDYGQPAPDALMVLATKLAEAMDAAGLDHD